MKHFTLMISLFAASLVAWSPSQAQDLTMKGRSTIELNLGLWTGPAASHTITNGGVRTEAKTNAFVGGVLFAHWLREYISVTLSAGLLAGRVSSNAGFQSVSQHVSSVVPVLAGMRYYPFESAGESEIRPYLSAGVGPYIGSEVSNTLLAHETRTETAFGGRAGAGIDWLASYHLKLGANAGYNLMMDFDSTVGERKNYSGADFLLGIGYIF